MIRCLLTLLMVLTVRPALAGEAAADLSSAPMLSLELQGVGELKFGDRFQWGLVVEPPQEVRAGAGIKAGRVAVRAVAGGQRHVLPEPPAYSHAESGTGCRVYRIGEYAILRCLQDYVFNTRTGAVPIVVSPQFNDRSEHASSWLQNLPLPWWEPRGSVLPGTRLMMLDYGYINYGQHIESTEVFRGPAILDLDTGKIAIARFGSAADSPVYDASEVPADQAIAYMPDRLVNDATFRGQRLVTILTTFDRCVANRCESDSNAGYQRSLPLTYVFE